LSLFIVRQMTPVWQMYLTKVHDLIKFGFYNYLKTGIPENIPLNKLVIYGQYFSKIEKVGLSDILRAMPLYHD